MYEFEKNFKLLIVLQNIINYSILANSFTFIILYVLNNLLCFMVVFLLNK